MQKIQSLNEAGISPATFDPVAVSNSAPGELGEMDCPLCLNRGYITFTDENGLLSTRECSCIAKRKALRQIRKSGLGALLDEYTFDNFETPEPWQESALALARKYAAEPARRWLYIFGKPGTGKSHLCTAICSSLLSAGRAVKYMLWRDESTALKASINDADAYSDIMYGLKRADVLYVDDFFKGDVTQPDIKLAFELLNSRYVSRRPTIISSELRIDDILNLDEALGSRIYEMAKGFVIHAKGENWRLR